MTRAGRAIGRVKEELGGEAEEGGGGGMDYDEREMDTGLRNRDMLSSLEQSGTGTAGAAAHGQQAADLGMDRMNPESSSSRRRSLRLSSFNNSFLTDWKSDNSSPSGGGGAGAGPGVSDSESEGNIGIYSTKQGGGNLKQRGGGKKRASKKISLSELHDVEEGGKKDDFQYQPMRNSDSEGTPGEEGVAEDFFGDSPGSRRAKLEAKAAKRPKRTHVPPKKRTITLNAPSAAVPSQSGLPESGNVGADDDLELQDALALSMGSTFDAAPAALRSDLKGKQSTEISLGRNGTSSQKNARKKAKQLYFTENEIDNFFVSIVGNKEGALSSAHLETAVSLYDFMWTKDELNDMIDIFDEDGDGQLNLPEFRKMAQRCDLMELF